MAHFGLGTAFTSSRFAGQAAAWLGPGAGAAALPLLLVWLVGFLGSFGFGDVRAGKEIFFTVGFFSVGGLLPLSKITPTIINPTTIIALITCFCSLFCIFLSSN